MSLWRATALVFVLLSVTSAPAAGAEEEPLLQIFARANAQYQKGDFAAAEASYLDLVHRGVDTGPVFYNLGNACFKQKKLGEAIYYWEMARRHMPGDQDVRENLELANLMVVDRIDVPASPFPVRVLTDAANFLTIPQETWIVLVLFAATNVLFGISILARTPRGAFRSLLASGISAALFLAFAASLGWKIYQQHTRREAVVVEQKTDVRSGPGTENVTVFTVHEGLLVRVRGSSGGWFQVSLANGWNGWVPSKSLRVLQGS
jgi:hypothetical protein